MRGDGNCFYRAFGFAYLEHLIVKQGKEALVDFVFRYAFATVTLLELTPPLMDCEFVFLLRRRKRGCVQ